FYNGLTLRHRDTINAAAGETFMKRRPGECYDLIENMTALRYFRSKECETCGGLHSFNDCLATVGQTQNVYAAGAYNQDGNSYQPQGNRNLLSYRLGNYLRPPGFNQNQNRSNPNQNYQNRNQRNNHGNPQGNNQGRNQFFQGASHGQNPPPAYQAPVIKPREDLKGTTTQSRIAYKGSTIPITSSPPKVVERKTEVRNDTVPPTNNGSTKDVQPSVVQVETQIPSSEPVVAPVVEPVEAPVSALKPNPKPSIPYPSRLHDQKLHEKANDQMEKFFEIFQDLNFNISFVDALILIPKFSSTIKNRSISCPVRVAKDVFVKVGKFHFPTDFVVIDFDADPRLPLILERSFLKTERALIDVYEGELTLRVSNKAVTFNLDQTSRYSANYDAEFYVSGNPTPCTEPIVLTSSPTLTPFGDSDFLLEETDAFLATEDEPISSEINDSFYDSKGDILLLGEFFNDDPSSPPLPPQELKVVEPKNEKSSIDEPPVVELKDLPPHLEYAFLEGDDKLPIIITKDLKNEKKTALIKVYTQYSNGG
nr:reverse transcriptase domain-containing protein [Tanacetum cinerariifolium]